MNKLLDNLTEKQKELVSKELDKRVHQAMQGVVYNLNTMHSRAGSQVPFSSVNLGIPKDEYSAKACEVFLQEYDKGLGKGEQPIFPNIIFRVKKGVNRDPGDPYYYLFKLACKVAAKRMNPTFMNIDADFNKEYYDKGYMPATMGCRTGLMSNVNGEPGTAGRGNIAPVTINLVRLGILAYKEAYPNGHIDCSCELSDIESNKSIAVFKRLLDDMLELSKEQLLERYNVLKKLKISDLKFVAGQNLLRGSEGLSESDSIEPILKQGTWGIGFIGLSETLTALTGLHHGQNTDVREFGYWIVQHIRDFCDKCSKELKLNFSCYATPAEGLSGKFIIKDKEQFGVIKGVTDKDYYTNSYHIPVSYPISIKDKIDIEAPFHKMCNGGHISYIEFDNYPSAEIVEETLRYAYTHSNISYIGINFHIRYCKDCGTYLEGSQTKCPNCESTNIQGISRVTGYLSLDERFGPGKYAERKDRTSHNNNEHEKFYNCF